MTDTFAPRIALIHALAESVAPIHAAFADLWPEAIIFDLLDTSLAPDRALAGECNAAITDRFLTLSRYAAESEGRGGKTSAILFTCSAFGPAIETVKRQHEIPVLKPNESGVSEALDHGGRIGLCVTFEPSLASLSDEIHRMAAARGQTVDITPILAEGAMAALKSGDGAAHDRIVRKACAELHNLDALILGQFSLARTANLLVQDHDCSIVTTPHSAVRSLKARMTSA